MKTTRRTFLKQIGAALALAAANPSRAAEKLAQTVDNKKNKLIILHCSDVHSHIDPLPANSPTYPNCGGYARRQTYIEKTRAEGYETLVLESGDIFEGTPYFNFYHGALEIQLMNRMGIDAVTIGNHEFDLGLDTLCQRIKEANFPFVCANYHFSNQRTSALIKPYKVLEKCGKRIGVFGLGVELKGLVSDSKHDNTKWEDPVQCAQRIADQLRNAEHCDLVIALTHIGIYDSTKKGDRYLAANTNGIDMILGGHSHTFMDEPLWLSNADGQQVMVYHSGHSGVLLSRIEVDFSEKVAQIEGRKIEMA